MALSDYFKFWNAKDATGVAADLDSGKTMYNDSGKITGTKVYSDYFPLPQIGRRLLELENPLGVSSSSFDPKQAYPTGAKVLAASGWPTLVSGNAWVIGTDGLAYHGNGWADYLRVTNAGPAIPSAGRMFECWGQFLTTGTDNSGPYMYINLADVSTDYWVVQLFWLNSISGYRFTIAERTASVTTTRAGPYDFATTITVNAYWRLRAIVKDDSIAAFASIWEHGSSTDIDATKLIYNVASRPNKTATGFKFSNGGATGGESKMAGCRIADMA